jgi:hypothetical protein
MNTLIQTAIREHTKIPAKKKLKINFELNYFYINDILYVSTN